MPTHPPSVRPDRLTLVLFAAVVLMAGTNVVAVRISNRELAPFWGAGLRFLAADLLLLALVAAWRLPLPRGRALVGAAAYGLLAFGAFFALGYWGLLRVPAGLASILLASVPLLTLLLARLHGVEPFRWRGLVGGAIAAAGIAVLVAGAGGTAAPLPAVLAILLGATCAAESTVLIKRLPAVHPIVLNAIGMGAGAAFLLGISWAAGESWRLPTQPDVRLALAYLVGIGSFALFVVYVVAVRRWTASGMAYQFVLMPLVAVGLSAWLDGEPLSRTLFVGGVLVLTGVYVGAFARPRPARAAARPT